jgi:uroporphyrinogen-III decarboxylase
MDNINHIVTSYEKLRADRTPLGEKFLSGERPYMIYQPPSGNLYADMRTPEQSFIENMKLIQVSLDTPSDHIPVLEPWFGTGIYASMYGCEYVWRDGEAPAVHYRYHRIDEVRNITKPRWEDSPVAHLVLDTIRYFKQRTGDAIPIVWTDTQSASDTATLILDACEVFAACIEEPETVMAFMRSINQMIIEFSRVQSEWIGDAGIHPGHTFVNNNHFRGLSVSDDNIPVGSPAVNRRFNLVLDEELGRAVGGVAIHSCGRWTHTMPYVKELVPSCVAIDCALDKDNDPDPCDPEKVRDIMQGSGIPVKVRMTGETERMLATVKKLLHPNLRLVVQPAFIDVPTAERNYAELQSLLSGYYS